LGKKSLRQQHGSPVGEGLSPLPTANGEAVGEADGVGTVWLCRGFANSFSFPTGTLWGKNPFANSRTLPLVLGFWAVGEDLFPDSRVFLLGKTFFANSSGLGCWESSGLLAKSQFPVVDNSREGYFIGGLFLRLNFSAQNSFGLFLQTRPIARRQICGVACVHAYLYTVFFGRRRPAYV
jgi:hypothetical protein